MLGGTMQRDVVRLAMVGTAGNGCVVAVQNNRVSPALDSHLGVCWLHKIAFA